MGWHLEDLSHLERTQVQFPAPTLGKSQIPATPVTGELMPSSGIYGHMVHIYTCNHNTYAINKWIIF